MRKVGYTLLTVITLLIGYGIIGEITFTPLEKKDFEVLFPNYNNSAKVSFHKDFIGWSHGDYFEMFIYQLDNVLIDSSYPKSGKNWEYTTLPDPLIPDALIITKWQKCPFDSLMLSKYDFELEMATSEEVKGEILKQDLIDATNYYSCIYVSELEKYLLLYSPSKKIMYYIRQRGF